MNDPIRELWAQCVVKHTKTPMNWQDVADEFAELIVRECANTLTIRASYYTSCSSDDPTTAEWFSGTVNGLKEGVDLIKNHFGVEE